MQDSGVLTENDEEKVETILNHLTNVFTHEPIGPIPDPSEQSYQSMLRDINITEIRKQLKRLLASKSPGADAINPSFVEEITYEFTKPLKIISHKSLSEAKTTCRLESSACLSYILKTCDKSSANNYRPMSLTSIICKEMELIIRE